jgi:hypothetical protein
VTQGVSMWHFNVYMNYKTKWFFYCNFLHSALIPFSWCFQSV